MPSAGVVIAKVPSAQLRQALEARAGAFVIYEPSHGWIGPDGNCIGEPGGSAYVCDGELALAIGASPDLLTNLSSELNTTVVACGYETVSGTYRFLAAERGKLLRYFSTSTSRRKPFTMGSPLRSEARRPLHTVEGIHAAVKYLGFDVARWHKWGSKVWFNYPEEYRKWQSEEGPLGLKQAEAAHGKEHDIPFEQWVEQFRPQVVLTHSNDPKASFIGKDGTGFSIEMQRSPTVQKQSWHNRLPNRPYTKLMILLCPVALLAAYFALQLSLQFVGGELPLWLRICCLV